MGLKLKRDIDGVPYQLTHGQGGWAVVCLGKRTDRFHRNYFVHTGLDGQPIRCTCPSCVGGKMWCKHLKAVEAILKELETTMPSRKRPKKGKPKPGSMTRIITPDGTRGLLGQPAPVTHESQGTKPPMRNLGAWRFSHDLEKRIMSAQASELPPYLAEAVMMENQVTVGFRLRNSKTGHEVLVGRTHTERNNEGETLWEEYRPVDPARRNDFVVVIYND